MRADLLPTEKRGMGFSVMRVVGVLSIASPLVAGFLYVNYGLVYGMRVAYFIVVAFLLISAILRLRLKETLNVITDKIELAEIIRGYPRAIKESVNVWRVVPRGTFYLFLVFSIVHFFVAMCIPYYVVYATKILGIEEVQWAILLTLESAIVFASAIPIGKLIDKFGRKKPLVVSNILFALSMPLFIYGDFTKLLILFFISAICNVMLGVSYESTQADLVAREQRGKVVGFTGFFENILMATEQLTGGFLYESISPQLPFMLLLLAMILTATLTMLLIQEPEKREV